MLGLSPLFHERIIHDLDIVPFMYYDLPTQDADQLDLPISPYRRYYIKFSPLHPEDGPQRIVRTEKERLQTLYSVIAQPQKEEWSRKGVTKINGFGRKVLSKFDFNCLLHMYYIFWNKSKEIIITDVDLPSINPNEILTIVAHF